MSKKPSPSLLPNHPMINLQFTQQEIIAILELLRFAGQSAKDVVEHKILNRDTSFNNEELVNLQRVFKFSNELQQIITQSIGIGEPRDNEIH